MVHVVVGVVQEVVRVAEVTMIEAKVEVVVVEPLK